MSYFRVGSARFAGLLRVAKGSRRMVLSLLTPAVLVAVVSLTAFRTTPLSPPDNALNDPLVLPQGWPMPPVPANNPITWEKFVLGRQLFYEKLLSGDSSTSCATCHDQYLSFGARGPHGGAFGDTVHPLRNVPRLVNLAYDTVLMWDGRFHTLEQQALGPLLNHAELQSDTTRSFADLASNPAYTAMFTSAFGDSKITAERVAQAIATFERCLISGNSPYDKYQRGETSQMSASAIRGMSLFFDTNSTNCSDCHNNLGSASPNAPGQMFSDNNYYRTGTFENLALPNGGYGLDTTRDTLHLLDAGRAAITHDSSDIGRFRTPTLRNVQLTPPYGANGTVTSLTQVIQNYNMGGNNTTDGGVTFRSVPNQDPRIKPLNLNDGQLSDLEAFLNSLSDLDFISNTQFMDPGPASVAIGDRIVAGDLSIYPNPAVNVVNAESPSLTGLAEASLVAENGATVWQNAAQANGRMRLDFTGIPNGVYRLEIRSNGALEAANIVLHR